MHEHILATWYEQYGKDIFAYIYQITKDPYEAEDVLQDTFIQIHKQLIRGQEIEQPRAFLFKVAHNQSVDMIRKQAPIKLFKELFIEKPTKSVQDIIEIKEEQHELINAIHSLKSSYRQVIGLRKIHEFSIKETCEILGWTESKVKTTLHRGLGELKKVMHERSTANGVRNREKAKGYE